MDSTLKHQTNPERREIISRSFAVILGLDRYFTGKPCSKGHVAERYISMKCVECFDTPRVAPNTTPSDSDRKRKKRYYERHKEKLNAKSRAHHKANAERKAANDRAWRKENIERERDRLKRAYHANPVKARSKAAAYRAQRRNATPQWLDAEHHEQIAAIYAEANRLTNETGVPHEVDHFIPLAGENVCGLHVPWNLRAITRAANRAKRNIIENTD